MSYTREVKYRFEVCGEGFAIRPFQHKGDSCVEVEETRKNGQEDTHMVGVLVKGDDGWQWDEGQEQFERYGGNEIVAAIPAFLNQNPPPTE